MGVCHITDFKFYINKYICDLWHKSGNKASENKLHPIKPISGSTSTRYRSVHREEVVLTILRLGHTYPFHVFLLKGEEKSICVIA